MKEIQQLFHLKNRDNNKKNDIIVFFCLFSFTRVFVCYLCIMICVSKICLFAFIFVMNESARQQIKRVKCAISWLNLLKLLVNIL